LSLPASTRAGTSPAPTDFMSVKESGDELKPAASVVDRGLASPLPKRTAKDYIALAIATCGVGYIPLAPGTWGSAVGVGLYLSLRWLLLGFVHRVGPRHTLILLNPQIQFIAVELIAITLVTLVGIWAASRVERLEGKKDPSKVVIDEVAGQLIALLPVPYLAGPAWNLWILTGFLLFRAFDIIKPYPVRELEKLPAGLGIVVDDLGAGAYAALLLSILMALFMIFA
jgi:phosphatidylglycerophosphatase A